MERRSRIIVPVVTGSPPPISCAAYWFGASFALVDLRLNGKAYQVASVLARLATMGVLVGPAWLLAGIRRDEPQNCRGKCGAAGRLSLCNFSPA